MDYLFEFKIRWRLSGSKCYFTSVYCIAPFLDAYAYSTEGLVGFSIGRKIKEHF